MATSPLPKTPAEITAWRLQRMAPVEHRSKRASGWIADVVGRGERLHQQPDDFGRVHDFGCDCFPCKRERVEVDQ